MEYPDEGKPGVWPVNAATATGRFRLLIGDVNAVEYEPAVEGIRSYTELSDAEIEGFLAQSADSVTRGAAYYYLRLAGEAAKESVSVQDFDLKVDLTKTAADLRAMAEFWLAQGDADDVVSGEEAFEIVPTGRASGGFIPEGSPAIWGREYTWGRWR